MSSKRAAGRPPATIKPIRYCRFDLAPPRLCPPPFGVQPQAARHCTMLGVQLTKWTIRLALACFVACMAGWLAGPVHEAWRGRTLAALRWLWTIGCGVFLAHVVCAFHFYHGWSHAAALEFTANETDKLLGIRFGEGIFFNYAFTLLWLADVVWMWLVPIAVVGQGSWPRRIIYAYLGFIAFNGAIVFEAGPTRWFSIAACLLLAALAARAAYNSACRDGDLTSRKCAAKHLNPEP
jgi:hypothetical protein